MSGLLQSLADELVRVRVDLAQYSETYFFREADATGALTARLRYAHELAGAGRRSTRPDLRLAGTVLAEAVDDYAHVLRQQFPLDGEDAVGVLRSYAADHGCPIS